VPIFIDASALIIIFISYEKVFVVIVLLDNLLRAEKMGWISSAESWIEIRTLRNKLVHEYMDSAPDLLQALIVALKSSEALTQTQKDLAQFFAACLGWDAQNKLSQK
jgi:hypothetical protein